MTDVQRIDLDRMSDNEIRVLAARYDGNHPGYCDPGCDARWPHFRTLSVCDCGCQKGIRIIDILIRRADYYAKRQEYLKTSPFLQAVIKKRDQLLKGRKTWQ